MVESFWLAIGRIERTWSKAELMLVTLIAAIPESGFQDRQKNNKKQRRMSLRDYRF